MSEYVFKLPDLGEGTVEAEIVEWHVRPGDEVQEGDLLVDVMTEKASVEVPAPVTGTVLRTSGMPGDLIAVGAELAAIETGASQETTKAPSEGGSAIALPQSSDVSTRPEPVETPVEDAATLPEPSSPSPPASSADSDRVAPLPDTPAESARRVITSPAIRRRAKEAGVDLESVTGTGPRGRILQRDLEQAIAGQETAAPPASGTGAVNEVKVIGVRRVIAKRLQAAVREIPHFTYVEEVDVTALESLRSRLNANPAEGRPALTYLPFIALALVRALKAHPQCNAHFAADSGTLRLFDRVHLGVATQTSAGLKVPVVRNASQRTLWDLASEMARVSEAARSNTARPADLTGSTITVTSLGRLGGIVSTPVINAPEVAIIGVNKAVKRPVVVDDEVVPRLMMNLSSSFDHRFVDGFDAASLIQAVKGYLEEPATVFIE
jgi:2-oxoisovalerate dehydrogenase E2 component (dihydrolipoyl transacylase)